MSTNSSATPMSSSSLSFVDVGSRETEVQGYILLPFDFGSIKHAFQIQCDQASRVKHQRDQFLLSLSSQDSQPSSAGHLSLQFIQFLLQHNVATTALAAFLSSFDRDFLHDTGIHNLVGSLPESLASRHSLLQAYYTAACSSKSFRPRQSALIEAAECGKVKLFALFGQQGPESPESAQELIHRYITYQPFLADLIEAVAPRLHQLSCLPETRDSFYQEQSLDLCVWLRDPSAILAASKFIASSPVSLLLMGILGLADFCIACKILGKTPGELTSTFAGVAGHSHGTVVATAIAAASSWTSFYDNARIAVEILFWIGFESHRGAQRGAIHPSLVHDAVEKGYGYPSSMLSVQGLDREQIQANIQQWNQDCPPQEKLCLSVATGRDDFVVAGCASALVHFNGLLEALNAGDKDQARVSFGKRRPVIVHRFLPVSAPLHSSHLQDAAVKVKNALAGQSIRRKALQIPVYHSRTGQDLREFTASNLIDHLIDATMSEPCDLGAAIAFQGASHIVSFGSQAFGELTMRLKEGHGVRVVLGSELESQVEDIGTQADLFSPHLLLSSTGIKSWADQFKPRLAVSASGDLSIETRFTQLLGTPPIMVAGMTPTTAHWDFVAAVRDAGYHVELAGGGYHNATQFSQAINQLATSATSARGVTCNLIYASPRSMAWQIALLRQLSQKGSPVDGLTIGAGVPSPEVVAGYINTLGLRHIAFKPGLLAAIQQVIKIAQAHPEIPIILQWTGGRAGGHHSMEDFHLPILNSYAAIRKCPNIVLVAGSGFGSGDDTYQYFTGSWSSQLGYAPMPFDGILLGSRMMMAREAHTSPAVKKCIAGASGVTNEDWEKTSDGAAGGIISVISEMGQPMHKIATRGVLFWAEMDKTIFSLPRKDRVAALTKNRDSIISRLNTDFAKPWFGRNTEGQMVDLCEMTYGEVLSRLVQVMYVHHQQRWINLSYTTFVLDFAVRALERFPAKRNFDISLSMLDEPNEFLKGFGSTCSEAAGHILDPEDVSFFLLRCKARGQKPVNFIPSLDEDFEYYFKKDSLWQSEDIEAVVDQDAGRVCILHGPVAAKYSREGDESAKDILDGIMKTLVERLRYDNGPNSPTLSSDGGSPVLDTGCIANAPSVPAVPTDPAHRLTSFLGVEQRPGWIGALFTQTHIMRSHSRGPNPFHGIVQSPQRVSITFDSQNETLLLTTKSKNGAATKVKMMCRNGADIFVELHQPSAHHSGSAILPLQYHIHLANTSFTLSEVMEGRNDRIKSFYSHLWFGKDVDDELNIHSIFHGPEVHLTSDMRQHLMSTVERAYIDRETMFSQSDEFPISIGMLVARDVLLKPLTLTDIDGDLLHLVHQSNAFEYCDGAAPLRVGDVVRSKSHVQALSIKKSGKQLVVEAQIERKGQPVMKVTSTFLFRGLFEDFSSTFRRTTLPEMGLDISSTHDERILRARKWFVPKNESLSLVGKTLLFRLKETVRWKNSQAYQSLSVRGSIFEKSTNDELNEIGTVELTCGECVGNPVVDYLQRKGKLVVPESDLKCSGWSGVSSIKVQMPSSNEQYSRISGDFNPIHVSSVFAAWAELPGTITHGMYTSSVSAGVLEHLAADGRFSRVRQWTAQFTGMVLPSDTLVVSLRHTGMRDGRMVFQVSARKEDTDELVLEAVAELEQQRTAYIFTGQGSQVQGMGMDLYNSSPVTKQIWDTVDKHFQDSYGWSIIGIIKDNPKTLTVHFRGKRGRRMRENYLALEIEDTTTDGQVVTRPILRNLKAHAQSYTFSESGGLLFSTQFAQLAILLFEVAAFEDLRSKGFIQRGAIYAGHSLGEYAAIWAFSGFMPLLSLMDLIFYRGLTMQATMARDEHGSTNFGMVAANPTRVGKWCDEKSLAGIVKMIATESRSLLEIVNFNVDGEQYVCAGTMQNLHVLGEVLNQLSSKGNISTLNALVTASVAQAATLPLPVTLQRGKATIPLQGIDVPFHSTQLLSGVPAFRSFLQQQVAQDHIHPERLIGRWIPNLLARPFAVDDEFVRDALEMSQSPVLKEVLVSA